MNIGLDISIAALGIGIVGIVFAALDRASARRKRREAAMRNDFMEARDYLKVHRGSLAKAAIAAQGKFQSDPNIPLLTRPGWIPGRPLSLTEVVLRLMDAKPEQAEALVQARAQLASYWPRSKDGRQVSAYSQAILELDPSTRMKDLPCYRLIAAHSDSQTGPGCELSFASASYFDGVDTGESLAYETALRLRRNPDGSVYGRYRSWLADPFRLDARAALPGINTLTICLSGGEPRIYMHRRGLDAGVSMGVFHVAPAGEFQPQIPDPAIWHSDLDILRNIIREYAEEFLGVEEAAGSGGSAINYEHDWPYCAFYKAFLSGAMKVFYLGMGLDPLSWKPEILTTCIFEQATFDRIFKNMVTDKIDEGTGGILLVGKSRKAGKAPGRRFGGLPLYSESTKTFLDPGETLPAGVACLALVRRWRSHIIPGVPKHSKSSL